MSEPLQLFDSCSSEPVGPVDESNQSQWAEMLSPFRGPTIDRLYILHEAVPVECVCSECEAFSSGLTPRCCRGCQRKHAGVSHAKWNWITVGRLPERCLSRPDVLWRTLSPHLHPAPPWLRGERSMTQSGKPPRENKGKVQDVRVFFISASVEHTTGRESRYCCRPVVTNPGRSVGSSIA